MTDKSKGSWYQLKFIFRFLGKFLWETDIKLFVSVLSLNVIYGLIFIPNIFLDKIFLDTLIAGVSKQMNVDIAFKTLVYVIAIRLALQLVRNLSQSFSRYYSRLLLWRTNQRLEVMAGQKYATISVPTIEDPEFKDRYQKIEREGFNRMSSAMANFLNLSQYITTVVASLSVLAFGQGWAIVLSLVSIIPDLYVEGVFIRRNYDMDTKVSLLHRIRGVYSYYLIRIRSYLESRLLNVAKYLGGKVGETWGKIIVERSTVEKSRRTWTFLAGVVDDTVSYSLDLVFAYQAIIGKITIGSSQAYVRAISNFKIGISNLTYAILDLYENFLYIADLVWFFDLEDETDKSKGERLTEHFDKGIVFENVWFKYPGSENYILKGVSFEVKPKQNIALVGNNGAGKTTLVKLLCGFYTPTKGRILVDGVEVSNLNKPDYWSKISALFQDFESYSVTAKESIAVGKIDKVNDMDRIRKYAKLAEIDDWIFSLPKKYDNSLSRDFAGGVVPSSGQFQKIGIARALFKDPEVLILDEPTSNVDPETEEKIFNQILKVGKEKIIVFISHRFSTVRLADNILVMKTGKLVEQGGHSKLMKEDGLYARLFKIQAKNYK